MIEEPAFTVSAFLGICNQALETSFSGIVIEGEVASFKVNQGKWVFFDLKDEESSVSCFLPLFKLRTPIQDGMKIRVKALPKVTKWGKFSLTVNQIIPVGEGNIKKSFELLKQKLQKEGLFDPARKRPLPEDLTKIGVISSTSAAGYADFCKIVNARWGGLEIQTCHTQVQGMSAPDQIIRALRYLNERAEVQVIAIIRGGGSADDLACFNDEKLAREIAISKIPVITGIGHEIDESLADLVADLRASTPSNCAEMLSRDRAAERRLVDAKISRASDEIHHHIDTALHNVNNRIQDVNGLMQKHISTIMSNIDNQIISLRREVQSKITRFESELDSKLKIIESMNPDLVLSQGYAILSGKLAVENVVKITTLKQEISAKITNIKERK